MKWPFFASVMLKEKFFAEKNAQPSPPSPKSSETPMYKGLKARGGCL
jgi:hypothetical protein